MRRNFFQRSAEGHTIGRNRTSAPWFPAFCLPLLLLQFALVDSAWAANWSCRKSADGRWNCGASNGGSAASTPATMPAEPAVAAPAAKAEPLPSNDSPYSPAALPSALAAPRSLPPATPAPRAEPLPSSEPAMAQQAPSQPAAEPERAADSSGKSGWQCRSGAGKKGWACAHHGPMPAATAKAAAPAAGGKGAAGQAKPAGSYAFTGADDSRFRQMLSVMGGDPWAASCAGRSPESALPSAKGDRAASPLEIDSDYSEMDSEELYTFTGNVDMARADQRLLGDFVVHDKATHTLNAHGNVIYRESGTTIGADSMFMRLDTSEGKLRNAQYIFEDGPGRGKAQTSYFDGKKHSRYETATFTTCAPGNSDWMIHASRLRVDKNTGRGVASNAWLEFKGVPLFYTPWLSFPTDKRRQSGFLMPNFGLSSGIGFSATAPYYWNIAPNYDATFYPRYNARRGMILGGDFRYLQDNAKGYIQGQFMPDDQVREQQRGFLALDDSRTLLPHLTSSLKLNYVSDNRYFAEMWNTIGQHGNMNRSYLPSIAALSYDDTFNETAVYSKVMAANYQILAENFPEASKPYRTMPQWNFGASRDLNFLGAVVRMDNEFGYFDHNTEARVTRMNIKPSISFPWQNQWGYLTPKLAVQQTEYWLDNSGANNPSPITSASRTTPQVSVDSGVRFDRNTDLFGKAYTQTLEPRLYYLYVPYSNQDNLPVVNSAPYDFNFASMFRENRYSGIDRMGDANQVSAALSSRLIDQASGREKLRFSVGKMVDLVDPQVTLVNARLANPSLWYYTNGLNAYRPSRSDVIAEASAAITDTIKVTPLVLWNYEDNRADRFQITTHYDGGNNQLLNVGYRYRRGVTDNTDVSMSWPITKEWSVVGRWQYAWQTNSNLEAFVGVQKETCCWRLGVIARHYMTNVALGLPANALVGNNVSSGSTQGVFVSLELKGFANIGDSIDHFLSYSIPGYETR